jgi:hypothetical protein
VSAGKTPGLIVELAGTPGVCFHLSQARNDSGIAKPASPTGDWLKACRKKRGICVAKPPGIAASTAATGGLVAMLVKIEHSTPMPCVRWSMIQNGQAS